MQDSPTVHPRARIAWFALIAVLAIETVGGLVLLLPVAQGFFAASGEPLGQRLSVFLAVLIAWGWVVATFIGSLRTRAGWVRGSALTIHVLMFAAGTGVLQGILPDPMLGVVLIALAFAGFAAALLAKPTAVAAPDEE